MSNNASPHMKNLDMKRPAGTLFWVLGVLFLLWNMIGCASYLVEVSLSDADYAKTFGQALADIRHIYPIWAITAFAVAVWGGLAAAIFYLRRKKWALHLFIVSFLALMTNNIWTFTNADYQAAAGAGFWVMPAIIIGLAIVEIIWCRKKVADGTLT